MAIKRNVIFHFDADTDTGLDTIPLHSYVVVDSYAGVTKTFVYDDNTGVTGTTTIADAVTASNLILPDADLTSIPTLASGVYNTSPTNTVNMGLVSATNYYYIRVGNYVTVTGTLTFAQTATGTATTFSLALPVASNLNNSLSLVGHGIIQGTGTVKQIVDISGDGTNEVALFETYAETTDSIQLKFTFSYVVV